MNNQPSYVRTLNSIEKSLAAIVGLLGGKAKRGARRAALSPARRAQLELQGRYLGYMRHLPKVRQAQVKAVKLKKGYLPAIALAEKLSTKR